LPWVAEALVAVLNHELLARGPDGVKAGRERSAAASTVVNLQSKVSAVHASGSRAAVGHS
jgi:hypothetical protein